MSGASDKMHVPRLMSCFAKSPRPFLDVRHSSRSEWSTGRVSVLIQCQVGVGGHTNGFIKYVVCVNPPTPVAYNQGHRVRRVDSSWSDGKRAVIGAFGASFNSRTPIEHVDAKRV